MSENEDTKQINNQNTDSDFYIRSQVKRKNIS